MADHDPLCPQPASDHPCIHCQRLRQARAEVQWRIGDAIATYEAMTQDELEREGWSSYLEGRRDAYDHAEQLARSGGVVDE